MGSGRRQSEANHDPPLSNQWLPGRGRAQMSFANLTLDGEHHLVDHWICVDKGVNVPL